LCRAVGQEIAALPAKAVVGFIKVSAKPLKASLSTWASKWVYLFTHYLQVRPLSKHFIP
jgi:dynein heavy chain